MASDFISNFATIGQNIATTLNRNNVKDQTNTEYLNTLCTSEWQFNVCEKRKLLCD